MGVFP